MHWILFLFFLLSLAYAICMAVYAYGWAKTPTFDLPDNFAPRTLISVIVPARNEEKNIKACLQSVLAVDYPPALWEILVVNDHSEDGTAALVENLFSEARVAPTGKISPEMHLLHLADLLEPNERNLAYKKKGIEKAIAVASGTLIVTTDADCIVQKNWLRYIAAAHELEKAKLIAAPVVFHKEKGIFQIFQSLDFLGMMAITAAGIRLGFQRMANGANFAYTKAIFEQVGGFQGIDHLASGDDMLFLQKVAQQQPEAIFFLKNKAAATATAPAPTLRSFFQQRLRWASKSGIYPEPWVKAILLLVFLFCWSLILAGVCAYYWPSIFLAPFLAMLLVKALSDFLLLRSASHFFSRQKLMFWFFSSFILHIFYIAFVGLWSQIRKEYEWKGRKG